MENKKTIKQMSQKVNILNKKYYKIRAQIANLKRVENEIANEIHTLEHAIVDKCSEGQ